MATDVTERKQNEEAVARQNKRLEALQKAMSDPEQSEADTLQAIICESCQLLDMERAYIGRIDGTRRVVEYAFPAEGKPQPGASHEWMTTCCGLAVEAQGPVLEHDLGASRYRDSDCCRIRGYHSYAGTPIRTSRGDYGVLSFTRKTPRPLPFDGQDRDFLQLVAGLIGAIVDRLLSGKELLQRAEELSAFNQAMINRESRVIELKEEINRLAQDLGRAAPYEAIWDAEPDETGGEA